MVVSRENLSMFSGLLKIVQKYCWILAETMRLVVCDFANRDSLAKTCYPLLVFWKLQENCKIMATFFIWNPIKSYQHFSHIQVSSPSHQLVIIGLLWKMTASTIFLFSPAPAYSCEFMLHVVAAGVALLGITSYKTVLALKGECILPWIFRTTRADQLMLLKTRIRFKASKLDKV